VLLAAASADDPPAKAAPAKPSLGDLIERAAASVVRVNTLNESGGSVGLGSGFVIDAKGYVATNYHVTRHADKLVVELRDGTKCDVKGYRALDREGDIAVLDLAKPPKGIKPLPLGPKDPPRQGDVVLAIGHPQGLNFTASTGIVSAVRQTSELPKEIRDQVRAPADRVWVQTSAPISAGNSGGPLLDEYGRVVGINTWIADGQNLGFGVHVGHLRDLLDKAPAKTIPLTTDGSARDVENPLSDPRPRVRELLKDYEKAEFEFQQLLNGARGEREALKIWENDHPGPKYARRFYEVATAERGTVTAFQALCLACRFDSESKKPEYLHKALDRLLEDHAKDKGMKQAVPFLARTDNPAVRDFLRKLVAKSPHREVIALGGFYLAAQLNMQEGDDGAEATKLLERCQTEYKDLSVGESTLGEAAKLLAHRVQFLSVGRKAADIKAKDVDGKEFKLSDFRGKVVLLDFFADWCPHCAHMYPHERKLVVDYASRPFAIVGVSADSKDTLRQLVQDKKVTWPCWWDGPQGGTAQQWQVDSYPTLYLLDHDGVIRKIISGRPEEAVLNKVIRELVAKAEAGKPAPAPQAKPGK
jgi:peroxiredoxin